MTEQQLSTSSVLPSTYSKPEPEELSLSKVFSTGCMYASTITVLTEQSTSFKQHWKKLVQHRFLEVEKCKLNEKKFHKVKGRLWENIAESLSTKMDIGILHYLVHHIWIPYIHQKLIMFVYVDSECWLSYFINELQELRDVASDYLIPIYSKQIILAEDIIQKMFQVIAEYITSHKKWEPVDGLIITIVSRLRNRLRLSQHTSHQIFELNREQFPDIHFRQEVDLLREIYSFPSIKMKKQKLEEFTRMVYERFYYKQTKAAIEYCLLLTELDGFLEMFQYIQQLGQCEDKQKNEIKSLKIVAQNLLSRDATGWTNFSQEKEINQYSLCRKAWRFQYNQRSSFNFLNSNTIMHSEPTWQTVISWNILSSNCEIPIATNVKNNFIKLGIITDYENIEDCRDYTKSQNVLLYCFSTGILSKQGEETKHTSIKKNQINQITLKISEGQISWSICDKEGHKDVLSLTIAQDISQKSRIIIIFRKGSLQAFPVLPYPQ